MTSFEIWNQTTQGGTIALKESFATTHPLMTAVIITILVAFVVYVVFFKKPRGEQK